jgi:SET and MYND domain-containing protein
VVRELHGRLSHALAAVGAPAAAALSLADAAELLRREGANGYGIMAPSAPDVSAACALVPQRCSMLCQANHPPGAAVPACPNAAGLLCFARLCTQGERRIRGTGLYAQASLVNHECLPNVARFDCFDSGAGGAPGSSTSVELRALHDIPAGAPR